MATKNETLRAKNDSYRRKWRSEAWELADELFPTDYIKDEAVSTSVGYPVYKSTAEGNTSWISNLGDRLELNIQEGKGIKTINIWIDETTVNENDIDGIARRLDALSYFIEDNVSDDVQVMLKLDEVRHALNESFDLMYEHLKKNYPNSDVLRKWWG